jgi:hypothetical protein
MVFLKKEEDVLNAQNLTLALPPKVRSLNYELSERQHLRPCLSGVLVRHLGVLSCEGAPYEG